MWAQRVSAVTITRCIHDLQEARGLQEGDDQVFPVVVKELGDPPPHDVKIVLGGHLSGSKRPPTEGDFTSRDADMRICVGEGIVDPPNDSIPVFEGRRLPRRVEGDEDLPTRGTLCCVVGRSLPVLLPPPMGPRGSYGGSARGGLFTILAMADGLRLGRA